MAVLEIAQIFIKHTANAATKVLIFPPWENWPSKVIWKVFLYLYFCHVKKDLKGGVKTVLGIKKNRCKMCRDLGNKNDGKIFKTLGKNWINCGNRGNYRKCFKNIFLIVKIKDVWKKVTPSLLLYNVQLALYKYT